MLKFLRSGRIVGHSETTSGCAVRHSPPLDRNIVRLCHASNGGVTTMGATALLTRRGALATLTAGALATRAALSADAPFRFGALDHLAIAVDDTEKSVHFYT